MPKTIPSEPGTVFNDWNMLQPPNGWHDWMRVYKSNYNRVFNIVVIHWQEEHRFTMPGSTSSEEVLHAAVTAKLAMIKRAKTAIEVKARLKS